jgi:hypothetical protein
MASPNKIFVRDEHEYERDVDVYGNATETAALYLQLQTGRPFEDCLAFVQKKTPKESRVMKTLERQENGDRKRVGLTFDALIEKIITEKSILTPNLVVYTDSNKELSCTAEYIGNKMQKEH